MRPRAFLCPNLLTVACIVVTEDYLCGIQSKLNYKHNVQILLMQNLIKIRYDFTSLDYPYIYKNAHKLHILISFVRRASHYLLFAKEPYLVILRQLQTPLKYIKNYCKKFRKCRKFQKCSLASVAHVEM